MRRSVIAITVALTLAVSLPAAATVDHLLPKVKTMAMKDCRGFALKRSVAIEDETNSELLREVLANAGATIDAASGAKVKVQIVNSIPGAFNHDLAEYPDEAYSIDVDENQLTINALTATGVIRAAQTLAQLAIGTDIIEPLSLTDWPAFKLRGYMHDVGRSFVSVDELKKQIRLFSQFKVNTFHWHLTENQAWRFEIKAYPQLTSSESMTRFAGQYYTQEQCREVMAEAKKYGITVIPEIDMPGHSEAYVRAMGHAMQTDEGKQELLKVLDEVADVFADAPYIHIGADEVAITDNTFLPTMIDKIHALGKKVVCWNPISGVNIAGLNFDMTQMWSTSGRKIAGIPNIDCRYNYINHFDVFADLVGIYKSSIYYEEKGTDEAAGTITAIWNDRKTPTEKDIIVQNNIYACVLASAERAWAGGGKQYIETGGTMLPNEGEEFEEFADWERRFLLHKSLSLKEEPIPYVKQTHARWNVTEMFDNGGNADMVFAPETSLENPTWTVTPVTGSGIYLRHTWGGTVPGLYANAPTNRTAYAYTYIYSPTARDVGAHIEFQNYGRSEKDTAPDKGKWDRKGSRLWLNDEEIMPPIWDNSGKEINNEVDLMNENFAAREPLTVSLKQGWNKVLVKLPYVNAPGVRLNKWMWTFALVDLTTGEADEELRYSPSKSIDDVAESVYMLIEQARTAVNSVIKDQVGYFASSELDRNLIAKLTEVEATLSVPMSADERQAQRDAIQALLDAFNAGYAASGINMPEEKVYYNIYTPLRNNKYAAAVNNMLGSTNNPGETAAWKFEKRNDGKFDIVNYFTSEYVSPTGSSNGSQLTLTTTVPANGWEVKPANEVGYVIVVSGSAQFNQSNNADKILNWGNGNNVSDSGCKYMFVATDYSDDAVADALKSLIAIAKAKVEEVIREGVGYYPSTNLDVELMAKIAEIEPTLTDVMDPEQRKAQKDALQSLYNAFLAGYAAEGVNQPQAKVFYNLSTPLRGNRFASAENHFIVGTVSATEASAWAFKTREDGNYDIFNYATGEYVSPVAEQNTRLSLCNDAPGAGWKVLASNEIGYVVIVSGSSQFNQTKAEQQYAVYNWGNGTRLDDDGCKYVFTATDLVQNGICFSAVDADDKASVIYDLQGRRLAAPVNGINIVNGRKVLVR